MRRGVSILIISALLSQDLALAAPELRPLSFDFVQKPQLKIVFPESVAVIEDAYDAKVQPSSRLIYLIQDAHANLSGQENLAKALEIILNHKPYAISHSPNYIFLEAGQGKSSLSYFRQFGTPKERETLARSFLKRGELHGEEYLDLISDRPFTLWGVEDLNLYLESLKAYAFVAKNREKYQTYLAEITSTINTLKPRIFNPSLFSFDETYAKYQKGELALVDYFQILLKEAKKQGVPLSQFPNLRLLEELKQKESEIDFKKANEEEEEAIASLAEGDQKELLEAQKENAYLIRISSNGNLAQKGFFALLEEKLQDGGSWIIHDPQSTIQTYPDLFKYFEYLKLSKQLHAKHVLQELKDLENQTLGSLAATSDERLLIQSQKEIALFEKLFNLKLTPEEFGEYKILSQRLNITSLTGFLNKRIMDLGTYYERAVFLKDNYEEMVKRAEEFYQLTYDRDKKFVENMLKKLDENSPDDRSWMMDDGKSTVHDPSSIIQHPRVAVLITGGFHTPNLKSLLKQRGISFISITPQVLQETNQARYEKILLNQDFLKLGQNFGVLTAKMGTSRDPALALRFAANPQDPTMNELAQAAARFARTSTQNILAGYTTRLNLGPTSSLIEPKGTRGSNEGQTLVQPSTATDPPHGGARLAENIVQVAQKGVFQPIGKPIIVIAEDDKSILRMYERTLSARFGEDYQYVFVDALSAAMKALGTAREAGLLKLVITDNDYPSGEGQLSIHSSGIDLIQEAKRYNVSAILISGRDVHFPSGTQKSDFVLQKPFSLNEFVVAVKLLLKSKAQSTPLTSPDGGARLAKKDKGQKAEENIFQAIKKFLGSDKFDDEQSSRIVKTPKPIYAFRGDSSDAIDLWHYSGGRYMLGVSKLFPPGTYSRAAGKRSDLAIETPLEASQKLLDRLLEQYSGNINEVAHASTIGTLRPHDPFVTLTTLPRWALEFIGRGTRQNIFYIVRIPEGEYVIDNLSEGENALLIPHYVPFDWIVKILTTDPQLKEGAAFDRSIQEKIELVDQINEVRIKESLLALGAQSRDIIWPVRESLIDDQTQTVDLWFDRSVSKPGLPSPPVFLHRTQTLREALKNFPYFYSRLSRWGFYDEKGNQVGLDTFLNDETLKDSKSLKLVDAQAARLATRRVASGDLLKAGGEGPVTSPEQVRSARRGARLALPSFDDAQDRTPSKVGPLVQDGFPVFIHVGPKSLPAQADFQIIKGVLNYEETEQLLKLLYYLQFSGLKLPLIVDLLNYLERYAKNMPALENALRFLSGGYIRSVVAGLDFVGSLEKWARDNNLVFNTRFAEHLADAVRLVWFKPAPFNVHKSQETPRSVDDRRKIIDFIPTVSVGARLVDPKPEEKALRNELREIGIKKIDESSDGHTMDTLLKLRSFWPDAWQSLLRNLSKIVTENKANAVYIHPDVTVWGMANFFHANTHAEAFLNGRRVDFNPSVETPLNDGARLASNKEEFIRSLREEAKSLEYDTIDIDWILKYLLEQHPSAMAHGFSEDGPRKIISSALDGGLKFLTMEQLKKMRFRVESARGDEDRVVFADNLTNPKLVDYGPDYAIISPKLREDGWSRVLNNSFIEIPLRYVLFYLVTSDSKKAFIEQKLKMALKRKLISKESTRQLPSVVSAEHLSPEILEKIMQKFEEPSAARLAKRGEKPSVGELDSTQDDLVGKLETSPTFQPSIPPTNVSLANTAARLAERSQDESAEGGLAIPSINAPSEKTKLTRRGFLASQAFSLAQLLAGHAKLVRPTAGIITGAIKDWSGQNIVARIPSAKKIVQSNGFFILFGELTKEIASLENVKIPSDGAALIPSEEFLLAEIGIWERSSASLEWLRYSWEKAYSKKAPELVALVEEARAESIRKIIQKDPAWQAYQKRLSSDSSVVLAPTPVQALSFLQSSFVNEETEKVLAPFVKTLGQSLLPGAVRFYTQLERSMPVDEHRAFMNSLGDRRGSVWERALLENLDHLHEELRDARLNQILNPKALEWHAGEEQYFSRRIEKVEKRIAEIHRNTQELEAPLAPLTSAARLAPPRVASGDLLKAGGEGPVTSPEQVRSTRRGARLAEKNGSDLKSLYASVRPMKISRMSEEHVASLMVRIADSQKYPLKERLKILKGLALKKGLRDDEVLRAFEDEKLYHDLLVGVHPYREKAKREIEDYVTFFRWHEGAYFVTQVLREAGKLPENLIVVNVDPHDDLIHSFLFGNPVTAATWADTVLGDGLARAYIHIGLDDREGKPMTWIKYPGSQEAQRLSEEEFVKILGQHETLLTWDADYFSLAEDVPFAPRRRIVTRYHHEIPEVERKVRRIYQYFDRANAQPYRVVLAESPEFLSPSAFRRNWIDRWRKLLAQMSESRNNLISLAPSVSTGRGPLPAAVSSGTEISDSVLTFPAVLSPDALAAETAWISRIFREAGVSPAGSSMNQWGLYQETPPEYIGLLLAAMGIPSKGPALIIDAGSGKGSLGLRMARRIWEYDPQVQIIGIESDRRHFKDSQKLRRAAVRQGWVKEKYEWSLGWKAPQLFLAALNWAGRRHWVRENSLNQLHFFYGDFNSPKFARLFQRADVVYYGEEGTFDPGRLNRTLVENLQASKRVVTMGAKVPPQAALQLASSGDFTAKVLEVFPQIVTYTRTTAARLARSKKEAYRLETERFVKEILAENGKPTLANVVARSQAQGGTLTEAVLWRMGPAARAAAGVVEGDMGRISKARQAEIVQSRLDVIEKVLPMIHEEVEAMKNHGPVIHPAIREILSGIRAEVSHPVISRITKQMMPEDALSPDQVRNVLSASAKGNKQAALVNAQVEKLRKEHASLKPPAGPRRRPAASKKISAPPVFLEPVPSPSPATMVFEDELRKKVRDLRESIMGSVSDGRFLKAEETFSALLRLEEEHRSLNGVKRELERAFFKFSYWVLDVLYAGIDDSNPEGIRRLTQAEIFLDFSAQLLDRGVVRESQANKAASLLIKVHNLMAKRHTDEARAAVRGKSFLDPDTFVRAAGFVAKAEWALIGATLVHERYPRLREELHHLIVRRNDFVRVAVWAEEPLAAERVLRGTLAIISGRAEEEANYVLGALNGLIRFYLKRALYRKAGSLVGLGDEIIRDYPGLVETSWPGFLEIKEEYRSSISAARLAENMRNGRTQEVSMDEIRKILMKRDFTRHAAEVITSEAMRTRKRLLLSTLFSEKQGKVIRAVKNIYPLNARNLVLDPFRWAVDLIILTAAFLCIYETQYLAFHVIGWLLLGLSMTRILIWGLDLLFFHTQTIEGASGGYYTLIKDAESFPYILSHEAILGIRQTVAHEIAHQFLQPDLVEVFAFLRAREEEQRKGLRQPLETSWVKHLVEHLAKPFNEKDLVALDQEIIKVAKVEAGFLYGKMGSLFGFLSGELVWTYVRGPLLADALLYLTRQSNGSWDFEKAYRVLFEINSGKSLYQALQFVSAARLAHSTRSLRSLAQGNAPLVPSPSTSSGFRAKPSRGARLADITEEIRNAKQQIQGFHKHLDPNPYLSVPPTNPLFLLQCGLLHRSRNVLSSAASFLNWAENDISRRAKLIDKALDQIRQAEILYGLFASKEAREKYLQAAPEQDTFYYFHSERAKLKMRSDEYEPMKTLIQNGSIELYVDKIKEIDNELNQIEKRLEDILKDLQNEGKNNPTAARLAPRRVASGDLLKAGGEGPVTSPEQVRSTRRGARLADLNLEATKREMDQQELTDGKYRRARRRLTLLLSEAEKKGIMGFLTDRLIQIRAQQFQYLSSGHHASTFDLGNAIVAKIIPHRKPPLTPYPSFINQPVLIMKISKLVFLWFERKLDVHAVTERHREIIAAQAKQEGIELTDRLAGNIGLSDQGAPKWYDLYGYQKKPSTVLAGRLAETQKAIQSKINQRRPPRRRFVKVPSLAYLIKDANPNALPATIRERLGLVNQSGQQNYESLAKFAGGAVILQMKDKKAADFYLIGRESLERHYKKIKLDELIANSPDYYERVTTILGDSIDSHDTNLISVQGITPREMIRMSDVGHPISEALTIIVTLEGMPSTQTKPAGEDAYLAFDGREWYIVSLDDKDMPIGYVSLKGSASGDLLKAGGVGTVSESISQETVPETSPPVAPPDGGARLALRSLSGVQGYVERAQEILEKVDGQKLDAWPRHHIRRYSALLRKDLERGSVSLRALTLFDQGLKEALRAASYKATASRSALSKRRREVFILIQELSPQNGHSIEYVLPLFGENNGARLTREPEEDGAPKARTQRIINRESALLDILNAATSSITKRELFNSLRQKEEFKNVSLETFYQIVKDSKMLKGHPMLIKISLKSFARKKFEGKENKDALLERFMQLVGDAKNEDVVDVSAFHDYKQYRIKADEESEYLVGFGVYPSEKLLSPQERNFTNASIVYRPAGLSGHVALILRYDDDRYPWLIKTLAERTSTDTLVAHPIAQPATEEDTSTDIVGRRETLLRILNKAQASLTRAQLAEQLRLLPGFENAKLKNIVDDTRLDKRLKSHPALKVLLKTIPSRRVISARRRALLSILDAQEHSIGPSKLTALLRRRSDFRASTEGMVKRDLSRDPFLGNHPKIITRSRPKDIIIRRNKLLWILDSLHEPVTTRQLASLIQQEPAFRNVDFRIIRYDVEKDRRLSHHSMLRVHRKKTSSSSNVKQRRDVLLSILSRVPRPINRKVLTILLRQTFGYGAITAADVENDILEDDRLVRHPMLTTERSKQIWTKLLKPRRNALFAILNRLRSPVTRADLTTLLRQEAGYENVNLSQVVTDTRRDHRLRNHPMLRIKVRSAARLAGSRLSTVLEEGTVPENRPVDNVTEPVVTFLARAYNATRRTGSIAVEAFVYQVELDEITGVLTIYGRNGEQLLRTDNFRRYTEYTEGDRKKREVSLTLSDFQILLQQSFYRKDKAPLARAFKDKYAVEEIDLSLFHPEDPSFESLTLPVLGAALENLSHEIGAGHQRYIFTDLPKDVGRVYDYLREKHPQALSLVVQSESELPQEFRGAPRIRWTSADNPRFVDDPNVRYYYVRSAEPGDVFNFLGMLMDARNLALVTLKTNDESYRKAKAEHEDLIGRKFSDSTFIKGTQGRIKNKRQLFTIAVPRVARLALNQILQGARLAARMTRQAA